jgi:hypothetical protein
MAGGARTGGMLGDKHEAGMMDVGSKVGASEEGMLMVPEIGTPGMGSWWGRASRGGAAAAGAGRWEGLSNGNS